MYTLLKALAATGLAGAMLMLSQLAAAADDSAMQLPGPLSETVAQAYGAYVDGNIEGIVELTTDDVDWGGVGPAQYGPPFGTVRGHAGVREWFAGLAAASDKYQLTDLQFSESPDTVLVTGTQSTRFKGSGKTESGPFAHVFRFRDGKISWFRNYNDSYLLVQASGAPMPTQNEGQANIQRVKDAYATFGAGDLDGLLGYFTDDIHWELVGPQSEHPLLGTRDGKAAVREWFDMLGSMIELQPFTDLQFLADGDTVVVLGTNVGRYRGLGQAYSLPFVHVFKFRDGKVYWFREHSDSYAEVNEFKASISPGPPGVEIMRY